MQGKFQKLLKWANVGLAITSLITCIAICLAYVYDDLPFSITFAAHISLFIFPALLKLSYIARLVAQHHLNQVLS